MIDTCNKSIFGENEHVYADVKLRKVDEKSRVIDGDKTEDEQRNMFRVQEID